MKQTAVDWYEKEINSLFEKYESNQISRSDFLIMKHNLFYSAKQMEKEQIEDAYDIGYNSGCSYMYDGEKEFKNKEQYYKETYEK